MLAARFCEVMFLDSLRPFQQRMCCWLLYQNHSTT